MKKIDYRELQAADADCIASVEALVMPLADANLNLDPRAGTDKRFQRLADASYLVLGAGIELEGVVELPSKQKIRVDLTQPLEGYSGFLVFLAWKSWSRVLTWVAFCGILLAMMGLQTVAFIASWVIISMAGIAPMMLAEGGAWAERCDVITGRKLLAERVLEEARRRDRSAAAAELAAEPDESPMAA